MNDHATIGLGFYPLIGANMLTGRFNLSTDIGKFIHFSGGADFLYNLGGAATDSGGGLYTWHLAGSVGTPTAFVNISYNNWETFDEYEKGTVIGAGFSLKTGKSFRVFSDVLFTREEEKSEFSNNVYRYSETIISVGSSWFNRVNKVDFGLTAIPGFDGFIWSNFMLPFGSYVRRF